MAVSSPPSQSPSLPSFPDIAISHLQGQAQAIHYRKSQLHRLHTELVKSKEEIKATNQADVGHTAREAEVEFALVLSEIRQHHNTLDPVCDLAVNRRIETGEDNLDRCKSVSIAYIVPSTHTLLYSVLSPCCAAIAAGCCVIVEVREADRVHLVGTSVADQFY
jgi:acyl-CoA reductase-like NAD-dependent aldehyde dehydrogenase